MRTNPVIVFVAAAIVSFAAGTGAAQDGTRGIDSGDWEVGILLGEPTGLSAKYWTTDASAFDIGVAWSFSKNGHMHLHADYIFHNFDVFDVSEGEMPLYFGVGGRLRLEDDSRLGIRFAVGVEYIFEKDPLALFLEFAPIVDFIPETEGSINGGLGIRYIF